MHSLSNLYPQIVSKTDNPFNGPLTGTTLMSRYQKGKTNLDLLEQRTVSNSGISWAMCKSAPCSRQITTLEPHHSVLQVGCPSSCPANTEDAIKILHY